MHTRQYLLSPSFQKFRAHSLIPGMCLVPLLGLIRLVAAGACPECVHYVAGAFERLTIAIHWCLPRGPDGRPPDRTYLISPTHDDDS